MTRHPLAGMSDEDLIDKLRKLGAVWFSNTNLLILEELIRRYGREKAAHPAPAHFMGDER